MSNSVTISSNLKFLLDKLGLKQRSLANSLKVSEETISTWVNGHYSPHRSNLRQLCDFFNDRLKNDFDEITPKRLKFEDLSQYAVAPRQVIREPAPKHEELPGDRSNQLTQGMRDLLADRKSIELMRVTEEEIEVLKGIRFIDHRLAPSKQFYIDALFDYRKSKEEL